MRSNELVNHDDRYLRIHFTVDLPRTSEEEKQPVPQIVVTPSTPRDEQHFILPTPTRPPLTRFKVNYEEDTYEYDLLPPVGVQKSGWKSVVPMRVLRITCVLTVVIAVLVVHIILSRINPSDDAETTT